MKTVIWEEAGQAVRDWMIGKHQRKSDCVCSEYAVSQHVYMYSAWDIVSGHISPCVRALLQLIAVFSK